MKSWTDKRPWLVSIGFEYDDIREQRWKYDLLPALQEFKTREGHLRIPSSYKTKNGIKIGSIISLIRSRGDWLDIGAKDLDDLGFDLRPSINARWDSIILPALKTYQTLHDDLLVPANFVVPSKEPWLSSLHGLKLGNIVSHIRSMGEWNSKRGELEGMGFQFGDILHDRWVQEIFPAFKTFENVHGHLNIPIDFVVPNSEPWPSNTHGISLGSIVNVIRRHASRKYNKSKLEDLELDVVQGTFIDWITGTQLEDWKVYEEN
jgi:hypothetical protein